MLTYRKKRESRTPSRRAGRCIPLGRLGCRRRLARQSLSSAAIETRTVPPTSGSTCQRTGRSTLHRDVIPSTTFPSRMIVTLRGINYASMQVALSRRGATR